MNLLFDLIISVSFTQKVYAIKKGANESESERVSQPESERKSERERETKKI